MIYFAQRNQDSYKDYVFCFQLVILIRHTCVKYFQQYAAFRKTSYRNCSNTNHFNLKIKELEAQRHEKNVLLRRKKKNLN